jgi:hypothetical protein
VESSLSGLREKGNLRPWIRAKGSHPCGRKAILESTCTCTGKKSICAEEHMQPLFFVPRRCIIQGFFYNTRVKIYIGHVFSCSIFSEKMKPYKFIQICKPKIPMTWPHWQNGASLHLNKEQTHRDG